MERRILPTTATHDLIGLFWWFRSFSNEPGYRSNTFSTSCCRTSFWAMRVFLSAMTCTRCFFCAGPRSLPSIHSVYAKTYPEVAPHLAGGEAEALRYYQDRLSTLSRYARELNRKDRALFVTYDQLLADTQSVFGVLQGWLGVEHPFTEQYKTHAATGKAVLGDFSDTIKSGQIVRGDKRSYDAVSDGTMQKAILAFDECSGELNQYCTTLGAAVPSMV